jgi:hypothetical protein
VNIDHLLDLARRLGAGTTKRPRQTDLRRAVSSAYYALFHALALNNANRLVGSTKRGSQAWLRVYRALEHIKAKDELRRTELRLVSPNVDTFASLFVYLQNVRHKADYDPSPFDMNKQQVLSLITQTQSAILGLDALPADTRTQLAVIVLLKARN